MHLRIPGLFALPTVPAALVEMVRNDHRRALGADTDPTGAVLQVGAAGRERAPRGARRGSASGAVVSLGPLAPGAARGRRPALLLALLALVALGGRGSAQPTLDALAVAQLPSWARPAFEAAAFRARYLPDLSLNPFVQSGDFDGDGFRDVAVLVRETTSGARGAALLRQGDEVPLVLGADAEPAAAGPDWSWLIVWHVEPRLPAGAALAPAGDTLVLAALDGARLWVFRDAGGWRWVVP